MTIYSYKILNHSIVVDQHNILLVEESCMSKIPKKCPPSSNKMKATYLMFIVYNWNNMEFSLTGYQITYKLE